jgi:hypothetical protein
MVNNLAKLTHIYLLNMANFKLFSIAMLVCQRYIVDPKSFLPTWLSFVSFVAEKNYPYQNMVRRMDTPILIDNLLITQIANIGYPYPH